MTCLKKHWALLVMAGLLSVNLLLISCATQTYQAKPLNSHHTTAKILARDPTGAEFNQFLIAQGYQPAALPLKNWALEEMTWCAMFYHDNLQVAKAQLAAANAAVATAAVKPSPGLNGTLAHSNQANGDIRPWSYGLNVDIPVETGNKRQIKVEEAQQLAIAAQLDVAETAWQLRSQIDLDLQAYYLQLANIVILKNSLDTQREITRMLQNRLEAGLADSNELRNAELMQLKSQSALQLAEAESVQSIEKLAADTGLSATQFKKIAIRPFSPDQKADNALADPAITLDDLQQAALLNRLDIRRSMAKYAAAEAKIKLEIARQKPDISLNPGILFDFGDRIWSLGFSSLLNLAQNNEALIAEAQQLRAVEGAQFEKLQAETIAQIGQAYTAYLGSKHVLAQTNEQYQANALQLSRLQQQFNAGLIDRLALTQARQSHDLLQQQRLNAEFAVLAALSHIENVLQAPLASATLKDAAFKQMNDAPKMENNIQSPIHANEK